MEGSSKYILQCCNLISHRIMRKILLWCLLLNVCSILSVGEKLNAEESYSWDENGYVFFCLCMGRFGNQVEHFLGGAAFAKALNRTLIIPPWITYRTVPFNDWFQLQPLQEYHCVILAEKFMKHLAPKYWPRGKRKGYCWLPLGSNDRCIMKEGFPFKVFWDELGVDFDDHIVYHISTQAEDPYVHSEWVTRFPSSEHPVIAFRGAPAKYPMLPEHVQLQRLLKWSKTIEKAANDYISENLRPGKFVGIHLRNEDAWIRGCDYAEGAATFMESPQCLGYSRYRKVTRDLCAPPREDILTAVKRHVSEIQAKFIFVASDNDPMLDEFKQIFDPLRVSVRYLNPERPQIDLAILGKADHFIGNCISSFTAFVKRERDLTRKPTTFWSF